MAEVRFIRPPGAAFVFGDARVGPVDEFTSRLYRHTSARAFNTCGDVVPTWTANERRLVRQAAPGRPRSPACLLANPHHIGGALLDERGETFAPLRRVGASREALSLRFELRL